MNLEMSESRVKNTSRNFAYAMFLQVVKIALMFGVRIIFVYKLGEEYLGVNGLFTNVIGILSLADLGMTTALMYSLYKPLAENDETKISIYINYFRKVYYIIALTITLVGIAIIPFLQYIVNLPREMPDIYLYYILLLANSVLSYLFVYKTTLLSADQKMYIINRYDIIFQFILTILQIAILLIFGSFIGYLLANIFCTLLGNILKARRVDKIYPYLKSKGKSSLEKQEKKNIFSNLFSLFFYKLGGVIQDNTTNIVTSIFVGTITVGYYSNYVTIISSITTFLTTVFTSLKASVGNYIVFKEKEEQLKLFNILETYNYWLVSFCSICFVVLIPDFILICFGQQYVLGFDILVLAVLNFYVTNIRQTIWAYRETTGIFKKTKYTTIITAIVNIGLSIILGYVFGLLGIIAASVIARMVYAWWKEPIIIYEDYFKTSPKPYFATYIKRLLLLIVICLITYIVATILPAINIYLSFILKMIICLIIPTFLLFIIYRKDEAFLYLKTILLKLKEKGKENG